LGQTLTGSFPGAVGGAVDRRVVHDHQLLVLGEADVELDLLAHLVQGRSGVAGTANK
jgi:hypothetical protein